MTAAGLVVTDLSHLGIGRNGRAVSAGRFGLLCRASPVGHRDDVIAYQRGALGRRER